MLCIFCQQQSKIHVLSASPDLHSSFYLCLLPQARTSDLTYDVGVEVDYFEYISLWGSFFFVGKKTVCSQCRLGRLFAFSHFPCPRASIATLKRSGVLPLGGTLVQNIVLTKSPILTKTRCSPTWLWKLLKTLVWKPLWVQVFSHLADRNFIIRKVTQAILTVNWTSLSFHHDHNTHH